jgi:hypothetical protein
MLFFMRVAVLGLLATLVFYPISQRVSNGILGEWHLEPAYRYHSGAPIYLQLKESANCDTIIMIDSIRLADGTKFRQELHLPLSLSVHTLERSEVVKWNFRPHSLHVEYYQKISKPEYLALMLDFELENGRLRLRKTRREFGIDETEIFYYIPFKRSAR